MRPSRGDLPRDNNKPRPPRILARAAFHFPGWPEPELAQDCLLDLSLSRRVVSFPLQPPTPAMPPAFNPRAVLGLPRRYIFLASFLAGILILTIASSHPTTRQFVAERTPEAAKALHPANWGLPFAGTGGAGNGIAGGFLGAGGAKKPAEFDEYGRCLFMSPFDALSFEEKQRAEQLVLEDVSDGIVRAKHAAFIPPHKANASAINVADVKETLTNPILGLLRDGERKWQDMLSQQSKTLDGAVQEYKTRWGRNPPKGFDEWWEFAKNRGVLLPDEYDS